MADPLKPCPFCGGEAESDTRCGYLQYPSGKPGTAIAVYCLRCSVDMMHCREDHAGTDPEDLLADLTAAWNRRALPKVAGEVEAILCMVRDQQAMPDESAIDALRAAIASRVESEVAREREACAREAAKEMAHYGTNPASAFAGRRIAAAIRARTTKEK